MWDCSSEVEDNFIFGAFYTFFLGMPKDFEGNVIFNRGKLINNVMLSYLSVRDAINAIAKH